MFNKIKKTLKNIKYLLLLLLSVKLVFIIERTHIDNEKQGLENLQFEYEIKETDEKTAQVLINITSNEGIESIKFQNKEGNEITLECNNKKNVGIDYEIEFNKDYYFNINRVGDGTKLEKINIDSSKIFIPTPLEYAVITSDGIKNVKFVNADNNSNWYYGYDKSINPTASDALLVSAYDGDQSTCAGRGKILIDSSAINCNLLTISTTVSWRAINMYSSQGTLLRHTPNFASGIVSYIFSIPAEASYIFCGDVAESYAYELSITSEPANW